MAWVGDADVNKSWPALSLDTTKQHSTFSQQHSGDIHLGRRNECGGATKDIGGMTPKHGTGQRRAGVGLPGTDADCIPLEVDRDVSADLKGQQIIASHG